MTISEKPEYTAVGKRPIRHDGFDKVIGRALYGADIKLPGMLYGKVLRSPHPHARIRSIDTSKAEAHAAVRAVATNRDLAAAEPFEQDGGSCVIEKVLARDKALYCGHPIAAVAAANLHEAEEALSLIEVSYEPLPWVIDVENALAPDAPVLHEHWDVRGGEGQLPASRNIGGHEQHRSGDLAAGFAAADLVVEREFRTGSVHQGYIEPQAATASWLGNDRLTIWCSSQGHFNIRADVALALGIPVSRIVVVPLEIGGGFGGKLGALLEPVAAVLARKSGRPVQMTLTRSEVLQATGPTAGSLVCVKIGATKQGVITAAQTSFAFEGGAYSGAPLPGACAATFASYNVENVLIDGYDVVTNKARTSPYRAPGAPIVTFAVESVVDELAERVQLDPIDFRLRNVAMPGMRRADGVRNGPIGAREVMTAVRDSPHYSAPLDGPYTGRGLAMGFCRNNTGMACAVANVLPNGTVSLVEGSVDIGGSRTAVAQQFAETLGLPVEDVVPSIGSTDGIGFTSATGGSGVVFKSGWAAVEAAHDVCKQLRQRVAMLWEVAEDEVEFDRGLFKSTSDPDRQMPFKEVAAAMPQTGGPVVGRGNLAPTGSAGSYAANIVDVEVDPETGKVTVLRFTAFQDAGRAVHPSYVEGQMQGGAAQGVGWALNEEYVMEAGMMLNDSLLDYRMPTALDLPMIDTVVVEVPNPGHPFGAKGVGEANIVPPLAAIANAIYRATKVRMNRLPMNPQAVVAALAGRLVD